MTRLNELQTPEPHFIPGYTGYCPQYIYRCGNTYGSTTNKLLIDPTANHAEKLILSNRMYDDYPVERPTLREIELVRKHEQLNGDPIYKHPIVPGYEGFIPCKRSKVGQRFSIAATEGLADFELANLRKKRKDRMLRHRGALQAKVGVGRSLGERSLTTNAYKLPLGAVRPECQGVFREVPRNLIPLAPALPYHINNHHDTSPLFIEQNHPEKYFKLGHGGHQPFAWKHYGKDNKRTTNDALGEFTRNYEHRKKVEWAPITNYSVGSNTSHYKPSGPIFEIYHRDIGLIPNYAGHVPGAAFRFGSSYGNDTRDAKRWLRGDFSNEYNV